MVPPCRVHEDGGKEKLYAASLSGGKDSTAMVLRLVAEGSGFPLCGQAGHELGGA